MSFADIFKSLGATAQSRSKVVNYPMHLWMDFIFWHEFSHIVLGHADFLRPSSILEFDSNLKELIEEELWIRRTLEAEADAYAAKMTFGRFSAYKHALVNEDNNKNGESDMYYDFFLLLNFLFGQMETWNPGAKGNPQRRHPLPSERNYIVQSFFPELDKSKLKKVSLSREALSQLVIEAFRDYELFMGEKASDTSKKIAEAYKFSEIADKYLIQINKTRRRLL